MKVQILIFWHGGKAHQDTFHVLSSMTSDLLTPPMSIITSKSFFSAVRFILDDTQSNLHLNMVTPLFA